MSPPQIRVHRDATALAEAVADRLVTQVVEAQSVKTLSAEMGYTPNSINGKLSLRTRTRRSPSGPRKFSPPVAGCPTPTGRR